MKRFSKKGNNKLLLLLSKSYLVIKSYFIISHKSCCWDLKDFKVAII